MATTMDTFSRLNDRLDELRKEINEISGEILEIGMFVDDLRSDTEDVIRQLETYGEIKL